jgi:signal transduction histidine kinase
MAERLERSFRELTQERDTLRRFVEDASHELRTPVTALKTFNELLTSGDAMHDSQREQFLLESQAQVARLEWIIKNLLDLSRLDGGLVSLELSSHGASEIVAASIQAVAPEAEGKGVCIVNKAPASGQHVTCDRQRIEMALVNLLDNGIKYSDPGQTVEIGWTNEQDTTTFWVKDHGRGIEAEDLPHIFDRFYRSRGATEEGSGLGLAIVKSVVSAHGGGTAVQSEPQKGSTFSFHLPDLSPTAEQASHEDLM